MKKFFFLTVFFSIFSMMFTSFIFAKVTTTDNYQKVIQENQKTKSNAEFPFRLAIQDKNNKEITFINCKSHYVILKISWRMFLDGGKSIIKHLAPGEKYHFNYDKNAFFWYKYAQIDQRYKQKINHEDCITIM